MARYPDEMLTESAVLTPRDMMARLVWQMYRYQTILQTPELDLRSSILIMEKWDRAAQEYRAWFELSELEVWTQQRDALFVEILRRLDQLERKGR